MLGVGFGVAMAAGATHADPVRSLDAGAAGRIEFRSLGRDNAVVWGDFALARSSAAKQPAMVVVHGSSGPSPHREGRYARELGKLGIATFVLDSFGPRGVRNTSGKQNRVSMDKVIGDAFAGLRLLATHPRIDRERIGVIGWSKGGGVALNLSASQFLSRYLGGRGLRFAMHISFYPWCGMQFRTVRPTRAPLLMIIGGADDYNGVADCRRYIGRMRAAGMNARLVVYPGAHHAFDHNPRIGRRRLTRAQNFRNCRLFMDDGLQLIDPRSQQRMRSRREVWSYFRSCATRGATIAPHPAARRRAMADVKRFVAAHLLGAGARKGAAR